MTFIHMDAQSWPCVCLACSFWCIVYCTSVHLYIRIDASHLDTLDGQRVDMKHVMAESNPKMVNGGRIQKMEGLSEMHARTGDDVNPVKAN